MIMISIKNRITAIFVCFLFCVCSPSNNSSPDQNSPNPHKAPLYWTVYEYHIIREIGGEPANYIPESVFLENIQWVEENLKPLGYNMIALDGWGDVSQTNDDGYRLKHSRNWQYDFAWWSDYLQDRGMELGIYDNPLWVHMDAVNRGAQVKGTDIPLASIIDPQEESLWFTWVQVNREGAEEYVKGNIEHYAEMGVRFLRVDFLSWFEVGFDKNLGNTGPDRPREDYLTALRWMKEACDEHGILLSLVMPELKNEAELEKQFGHMFRINEDTYSGSWERFSEDNRGIRRDYWSQWANAFDGYIYWSKLAGPGKVILDGDFIRLNTFETEHEKRSVITLHLMAGGPLAVADQFNTIGDNLSFYQNEELLALNEDAFVGKPLSNDPNNENSQIWYGQLSNGNWIVALFNREEDSRLRIVDFGEITELERNAEVRDLWKGEELGSMQEYREEIPARGVTVLQLRY